MTIGTEELRAATGKGVRVLVIDSGVETSHPGLAGRAIRTLHLESRRGRVRVHDEPPQDVYGHGTAVCEVIARYAPDAEITSLRALDGQLRGSSDKILAALRWGLKERFDILNCSFGATSDQSLVGYKKVVDRAFCRNVWIVSACNNFDFRKPEYPGSFPSVLATDYARLPGLDLARRRGHLVELAARGSHARVAWKGGTWRRLTGSSFAAPHLAALCARIREIRPAWNSLEAKVCLYDVAARCEDGNSLRVPHSNES